MSAAPPPLRLIDFTPSPRRHSSAFRGWATLELLPGINLIRCPTHEARGLLVVLPPVCDIRDAAGRTVATKPVLAFESAEEKNMWCRAAGAAVLDAHPDLLT
jgi:hypothetical protein